MTGETIGQLHDSIPPGGHVYRRVLGQTYKITRLVVPDPEPDLVVDGIPSYDGPAPVRGASWLAEPITEEET